MRDAGNPHAWLRPTLDYGPLAVFFVTYVASDLMAATGAIIFASLAALLLAWTVERRVPMIPVVTTMLIVVFGGLTLWLQDETFIKMKPTIVQVMFAAILLGGLVRGRSLLKPLLGAALPQMSDAAWRQLTLRYALFFLAMAAVNEVVWRTQSTDFWVSFKVFGLTALTFLFILSQIPFLGRHTRKSAPVSAPAREAPGG